MSILEINLKNPITDDEINGIKSKLTAAKNFEYLIIDTGKHDFASISVIKFFREQMVSLESYLLKFKKIALIHPAEYKNESSNPQYYDYFISKHEAKKWFVK